MTEAYKEAYISRLQHEYHDLAPVAKRFAEMLVREIYQMTIRHDIPLAVPIEHRVKTWSSIEDKLKRYPFHGASLCELHDLIGIRLILLFKRDISRTCDLIEETFQVSGRRDKGKELSHEQFGYQSFHMIAWPPKAWLSVPSFAEFRRLQAEIQVRTLAQHMWAAASHKLQYKQEDAVPPPIKRSIHRVSALLETIDLEFERVLAEREEYRSELKLEAHDRKLNSDALETLLDTLLPRVNKEGFEPYSLLLWELEKIGITTTEQMTKLVQRHLQKVIEKDHGSVRELSERGADDERTKASVYFSHTGLVRLLLTEEFGDNYYSCIWEQAEKELEK